LTVWYEKALRGQYGEHIGAKMLQILSDEIKIEFPITENVEFVRFCKGRGYDKLTDKLWDI
jgi:type II restriction enzyme